MATNHKVYYELAEPSAVAKKLAKLTRYTDDVAKLEELKPWQCVALARHVMSDWNFTEIGRETKHSPATISALARSPAGRAFIEKLHQECSDPVRLVKNLMAGDTVNKWAGWQMAWDWAVAAQDYEAIHKMAKDIGLQPALEQEQKAGPTKISLHLNLNDLAAPIAKSTFSIVEDAEYTIQDPADDSQAPD
jgi:hypothetical protein